MHSDKYCRYNVTYTNSKGWSLCIPIICYFSKLYSTVLPKTPPASSTNCRGNSNKNPHCRTRVLDKADYTGLSPIIYIN